mmetsp:Transcript_7867/g.18868  ORF Transcript_7867/g.18868 Transcript_7867/m.18868 type:complete len:82 (+) Transcript_7867:1059-1304(+)
MGGEVRIICPSHSTVRRGIKKDTTSGKFNAQAPHQKGLLNVQQTAKATWSGAATYVTEKTEAAKNPMSRSSGDPPGLQRVG